jgi:hypothetical protein
MKQSARLCVAEVKNEWSFASTPTCGFMTHTQEQLDWLYPHEELYYFHSHMWFHDTYTQEQLDWLYPHEELYCCHFNL